MTTARVREPATYHPESRHSFFADLVRSTVHRDDDATARLQRHRAETADTEPQLDPVTRAQLEASGVEFRTNPNTTLGTGGEFAPPAWLNQYFGTAAVAGRVLADVIGSLPLPAGVSSINIPRMPQGGQVAPQAGQGGAVTTVDETSADAGSPVVTVSGFEDVAQQLLDQTPGGYDAVAFTDLSKNYNKALDGQLFAGTGSNGQLLGVTQVTGITSISGTGGTTIANIWPLIGQVAAGVGNNRQLPVQHFFLAPRRWAWIASSVDNSQRPIASPSHPPVRDNGWDLAGDTRMVGSLLGKPAWEAGAITAGANADYIVGCRPDDMLLFESAPRFTVAVNPTSGTLQARLRLHRYVAYIPHRYPTGIGVLTSIPAPLGF